MLETGHKDAESYGRELMRASFAFVLRTCFISVSALALSGCIGLGQPQLHGVTRLTALGAAQDTAQNPANNLAPDLAPDRTSRAFNHLLAGTGARVLATTAEQAA
jgi:hypothetical protein